MKKLIIVTAFIFTAGTLLSQNMKKGSYLGIQDLTVTLSADVTWKQYLEFTMDNFIPEAEMAFPGMSVFVMRGGIEAGNIEETEEMYSLIYFFESKKVQRKYFDNEGNLTDAGATAMELLEPIFEMYEKLGTNSAPMTGWMIL